ncbi:hypothetical protein AB4P91_02760 [Pseudomonas sp. B21128]|uniref:hypothetical protein n=1 Tax=Pseudomonas sp. B21128 TaxID=3235110 RepID=UPI00378302C4
MAGKPPKIKPAHTKNLDFNAGTPHRPPRVDPPLPSVSHRPDPLLSFWRPDSAEAVEVISVIPSLMPPATPDVGKLVAKPSLEDYWIPTSNNLGKADALGIRALKQRQYVAVDEEHFVQVVRDAESGMFRAAITREREASGPLLAPDSEGRFWYPVDSHSAHGRTAALFHRMGYSIYEFSEVTVARILAVSGFDDTRARPVDARLHPGALLQDTLRRFRLDQTMGRTEKQDRAALFQAHERAFELDCDENTLQLRRIFPELPKTFAEAIWRTTSSAERLHMHNQSGIPRRVAEEALMVLRAIRLARAVEGVYLNAVSHPDSDRLALHMVGRLADWPQQVRIEMRQGAFDGHLLNAIGDARSPARHVLVRQDAGYAVQSTDSPSPQTVNDLPSAVWSVLSPSQRKALGMTGGSGASLLQLIRVQPLPSNQALSEVLGLAPLPYIYEAPFAPHRQAGHLRGGADHYPAAPKPVADRVRDLYPAISEDDVATFINERLHSDPHGVLIRLEKELAGLRQELARWSTEEPPHPTGGKAWSVDALAEQVQRRQKFSAMLQDIWQRKSVSQWGYGDYQFLSFFDFAGELPRLSARFEYVTELVLSAKNPGAQIGAFLDSFPNVQQLLVTGVEMKVFPPGIFQMRELRQLMLRNCSLRLSEATAEGLSRIETITYLSLEHNPLTVAPHVGYMHGLTELIMHDAHLSQMPSGIGGLKQLNVLSLENNLITDVGHELLDIPDTQALFIDLTGNPLTDVSRNRITQYLEQASMDREMKIIIEEVFSEAESDSDSSERGYWTDSES